MEAPEKIPEPPKFPTEPPEIILETLYFSKEALLTLVAPVTPSKSG